MLPYIEQITTFSICIIYTWFIYRIIEECFPLRPQKWVRVLFFMVLFLCSSPFIYSGETTGTLGLLLGFFLAVFLASTSDLLTKVSFTLILYPIWTAVNYLTEDLGFVIWRYGFKTELSPSAELLLHSATMLLRILFWYSSWRVIKQRPDKSPLNFSKQTWLTIDVICLASFLGIITIIYNADLKTSYFTWPACIACILTNIGIYYLCGYMAKSARTEVEVEMLRLEKNYYEELEASQTEVRKLRHDMKNHFNVALSFLNNRQPEMAQNYLTQLSGEFSSDLKQFCENSIVNALLNAKYRLAQSNSISCQFHAELSQDTGIDPVSLCSLVANTLDNAVEACCKVLKKEDRRILLKARCSGGYFSYYIENSYVGGLKESKGIFQTTKKESSRHGFGLQNVKDMIQKYNGTLDISYTDHSFSVTVLIPIS